MCERLNLRTIEIIMFYRVHQPVTDYFKYELAGERQEKILKTLFLILKFRPDFYIAISIFCYRDA